MVPWEVLEQICVVVPSYPFLHSESQDGAAANKRVGNVLQPGKWLLTIRTKGFAYTAFDIQFFCISECLGEAGDDHNARRVFWRLLVCRVAEVPRVDVTLSVIQQDCTLLYMHQVVADKER
jgi:hypothetical protein